MLSGPSTKSRRTLFHVFISDVDRDHRAAATDGRTDGLGSGREGHPWTDRAKPFLGRFTTKDEQEEKRGTEKEKERTKTISRNGHRRRLAVLTHRVFSTEPEIRNPSNGSEGHCQGT